MGACDIVPPQNRGGYSGGKNPTIPNEYVSEPVNDSISVSNMQFRDSVPNKISKQSNYNFPCFEKDALKSKSMNLTFKFSKIKIKHVISHSPDKNSKYITIIHINNFYNDQITKLGKYPAIDKDIEFNRKLTIEELENTILNIHVYEFFQNDAVNIPAEANFDNFTSYMKKTSKYYSYFRINLSAFLYRPKRCDFKMFGKSKPLSDNTRISFICDIIHKEIIKIKAEFSGLQQMENLVYMDKNIILWDSKSFISDKCSLKTPEISMKELKASNIFLETKDKKYYEYVNLNDLKNDIIIDSGSQILSRGINAMNSKSQNQTHIQNDQPFSIQGFFFGNNSSAHKNEYKREKPYSKTQKIPIKLTISNMPEVAQISSLYFTENKELLYNSAILNMINPDQNIHEYRRNNKISADDFYKRVEIIYNLIENKSSNIAQLSGQLNDLLKRSIDSEKFYYLYPDEESLKKMTILFLKLGIQIIHIIQTSKESELINSLILTLTYLVRREELDNSILIELIEKSEQKSQQEIIGFYQDFLIKLLELNRYCKQKNIPNINMFLIDLYSGLYLKKRYIREAIFKCIYDKIIEPKNMDFNFLIYDIAYDNKLCKYLNQDDIYAIIKEKDYFSNLFTCGNVFFKTVIIKMSNLNINDYPFDFLLFDDNNIILEYLSGYLLNKKIENLENDYFDIAALLANSYNSINYLNSNLIRSTNSYNNIAIYKLLEYLRNLLDFYHIKEGGQLVIDYSLFEDAISILINNDNSIALVKLFWFYYYCSHLVLNSHLRKIILNTINMNFNIFAYHWSFTVRQAFFRLIKYILLHRLKKGEGQLFNSNCIASLLKPNNNNNYNAEAIKDYYTIDKEYTTWENMRKNNIEAFKDYPIFIAPLLQFDLMNNNI